MAPIICRPAALVRQGNLRLYATSLRASDLLTENFYDIDRLDPDNPNDKGYQRVLNKARAKRLAEYILDGQETHDAFLPTSIFLATDRNIEFDASTNTIRFDVRDVGPFSVVDGQHRIEGLRMAAEKNPNVGEFEVPVNIAANLPKIAQMCHFLIVNTTQKSVDTGVEQRIFARLTDAVDTEDVPNLPRWIARIVEKEEDKQALRIVDYLNKTPESPWFQKIEMANQDTRNATISQKSFVKAVKKYLLTPNNPISTWDVEKQQKVFFNYWRAIANLLVVDDGKPTVVFKYLGVDLFCRFSVALFGKLQNMSDFKVTTIERTLQDAFDNAEGEAAGVGHPDWWLSGSGPVGGMNAAMLAKVNHDLIKALHKQKTSDQILL